MIDFIVLGLTWVLSFLFVITIVITVHELGHFYAARLFGVKVDRFSLGFGPTLWSKRGRKGVEWRLAAWPIGGYVKFSGDANAAGVPDADDLADLRDQIVAAEGPGAEKNYYHFKPVWQRAIIAAAGPMANFVLAVAVFACLYGIFGDIRYPTRVERVEPNSPAAAAGFKSGDVILFADGEPISRSEEFVRMVSLRSDTAIPVVIERAGQRLTLTVTPKRTMIDDSLAGRTRMGRVGLALTTRLDEVQRIRYTPLEAVGHGFKQVVVVIRTTMDYIGRIFVGKESGEQLSGPIGTAKAAGTLVSEAANSDATIGMKMLEIGFNLIQMVALMSVSIGFINLMPIPVLDGGHLLFYAYEAVARRPLAARIQEVGYQVGLALVLGLMLFATWNDLQKHLLRGLFS